MSTPFSYGQLMPLVTKNYGAGPRSEEYWCLFCGKALPVVDGVVVHDAVPHPADADFDEEERPQ